MVKVVLFDDFEVLVDTDALIVHKSFLSGKVDEWSSLKFMYEMIVKRPKAVMIDVGAHVGSFTLLTVFCRNLYVYAVEPLNSARETLTYNLFLNDVVDQVRVIGNAISNTEEKKIFVHNTDHTKHSCIKPPGQWGDEYPCPWVDCLTLDELYKKYGIDRIDFIKIDAEGHEYQILDGARETLDKFHPDVLIECDASSLARHGTNFRIIYEHLSQLGYMYKKQLNEADWYFSTKEIP